MEMSLLFNSSNLPISMEMAEKISKWWCVCNTSIKSKGEAGNFMEVFCFFF